MRRLVESQSVSGELLHAERVVVGEQRHDVVHPFLDVGLAHPQLDLLVEKRHHRHRVGHPAVDADQGDGSAAANDVDRRVHRREPVDSGLLHDRLGHEVGQVGGEPLHHRCPGRPVRLHADGVDHRVGSAPASQFANHVAEIVFMIIEVDHLGSAIGRPLQPLRNKINCDHPLDRSPVPGDPHGHVTDRSEAEHDQGAAVGDGGVLQRLPGRGQHVGEEQEAVVVVLVGHVQLHEVGDGDQEVLRLAAGKLAV